jgi:hypothetical protein
MLSRMCELEKAIALAITANGRQKEANKAYLEFIKANFIIPIEKHGVSQEPEVLYIVEEKQVFLPVFTSMNYFDRWAIDIKDDVQLLKLSGIDLLKGIGENVIVCLNIGSQHYKEFNSGELARMRSMILKLYSESS